jgi:predicted metal-dependent hydrolase
MPYLGQPLSLKLGGLARYEPQARELHLGLPQDASPAQVREAALAWLAGRARALFEQRCRHYAAALSVRYTRLSLSQAQTRWGSASANGSIRLSWRLIHLDPDLIDYVVVHELAHLHEMNHSPRFWAVVASVLPDYESARRRLREAALPTLEL